MNYIVYLPPDQILAPMHQTSGRPRTLTEALRAIPVLVPHLVPRDAAEKVAPFVIINAESVLPRVHTNEEFKQLVPEWHLGEPAWFETFSPRPRNMDPSRMEIPKTRHAVVFNNYEYIPPPWLSTSSTPEETHTAMAPFVKVPSSAHELRERARATHSFADLVLYAARASHERPCICFDGIPSYWYAELGASDQASASAFYTLMDSEIMDIGSPGGSNTSKFMYQLLWQNPRACNLRTDQTPTCIKWVCSESQQVVACRSLNTGGLASTKVVFYMSSNIANNYLIVDDDITTLVAILQYVCRLKQAGIAPPDRMVLRVPTPGLPFDLSISSLVKNANIQELSMLSVGMLYNAGALGEITHPRDQLVQLDARWEQSLLARAGTLQEYRGAVYAMRKIITEQAQTAGVSFDALPELLIFDPQISEETGDYHCEVHVNASGVRASFDALEIVEPGSPAHRAQRYTWRRCCWIFEYLTKCTSDEFCTHRSPRCYVPCFSPRFYRCFFEGAWIAEPLSAESRDEYDLHHRLFDTAAIHTRGASESFTYAWFRVRRCR